MEFKKEDFSSKFRSQFNNEEFQILMDFCRCYYAKFGKYTSKDEIINQIEKLDSFTHINDENSSALATHFVESRENYTKIQRMYIRINDAKWNKANIEEKKAIIYHELMHHFSTKEVKGKKIQSGLMPIEHNETAYFDEIMTEYYATELLRMDNIDMQKFYNTYKSNNSKIDRAREFISSKGIGYVHIAGLGQVYDRVLGKRLFDGKTKDYDKLQQKFNERFRALGKNPLEIINKQLKEAFANPNKNSIYKCYQTALEIFNIDRNTIYGKEGFDLYNYLLKSNDIIKSMPIRDINQFAMDKTRGIPEELFDTISGIDRDMIVRYIRPDILQIKDEDEKNREINKLSSVINILRENIGSLSQEDIEQITYGKIDEYTHNGLDCLVIKAGDKSFQTFVNNSSELNSQFMPYCSFKNPERYDNLLGTNTDQQMRQTFEESGHQLGDSYTMSTVMNVGGEYAMYGLVENNGIYYKTSGELQEVQIANQRTIAIKSKRKEQEVQQPEEAEEKQVKSDNSTPNKKMAWIKKFIENYDTIESDSQYGYREMYEDDNTLQVLRAIDKGEFVGEGLSKIEISSKSNEFDIKQSISKIARLLKCADNITIDGGRNYLEEFANIPNVTEMLLLIKNSESCKEMFAEAEKSKINGTIQQHKKTKADVDKDYAQEYLRSENISQPTVEEELAYREEAIRGGTERVVDFNAKNENEIPIDRRQKTAVERIIARQQGKVPGEIIERNGMLVFEIDTHDEKERAKNNITPQSIVSSTLIKDTTMEEINSIVNEIRKTQTRDLQKSQQK